MSRDGVGTLVRIEGNMDAQMYVDILKKNVKKSARKLKLGKNFTFQQDSDPKHTSKLAKAWFEDNNVKVLEWPAMSPVSHKRKISATLSFLKKDFNLVYSRI